MPSTYARRKPGKVITRPLVANSASSPLVDTAPSRTVTLWPTASAICDATVRIHTSSYSRRWSPWSPVCSGVRKLSPAGRMASWASWAFLTFLS